MSVHRDLRLPDRFYVDYFTAYDCGMFVIATAEHLCKELCEGYSIPLVELVTQKTVTEGRQKIKDLIYQTAKDYSGSWLDEQSTKAWESVAFKS